MPGPEEDQHLQRLQHRPDQLGLTAPHLRGERGECVGLLQRGQRPAEGPALEILLQEIQSVLLLTVSMLVAGATQEL